MFDMCRICDECECPQFPSPSGWVCRNGHGGAPWHPGSVDDYQGQYQEWFSKILEEIRNRVR